MSAKPIPTYTLPAEFQAVATRPAGLVPFSEGACLLLDSAIYLVPVIQGQISDATFYPDEIATDWDEAAQSVPNNVTRIQTAKTGLANVGVKSDSLPLIEAELTAYSTKVGHDCDVYSSGHT